MIELKNLTIAYGAVVPIADLDRTFAAPLTVVEGPSGSGKSSLLRVIAGSQSPAGGGVLVNGVAVGQSTWRATPDTRVVLIHQDHELVDFLSVSENLRLAAELRNLERSDNDIASILDRVRLAASFQDRRPSTLSGGERQRVAIARALICEVEVLLADEPTGALDAENTSRVAEVLREVSDEDGVQVVVATHDPLVASVGDEQWRLASGTMERM